MGRKRRFPEVVPEPLKIEPRCHKRRYASREEAEFARRGVYRANARNKSRRGLLNVYFCTTCDGWHVGHDRPWLKGKRK